MRALFPLIITALLTASAHSEPDFLDRTDEARKAYFASRDKAETAYRKVFSEAMSGATKIEVYLVDFEMTEAQDARFDSAWAIRLPEDQFPVIPDGKATRILKRKLLSPDEMKLLMPGLQAIVGVEKNLIGPMCHLPVHGIRVWEGEDIIFQTTLCYECGNFYMTYPLGDANWVSLLDPNIKAIMERLMPIPKSETDRLEAKYKRKKATTGK